MYGDDVELRGDDVRLYEHLVRPTNSSIKINDSKMIIKDLIDLYGFMPVPNSSQIRMDYYDSAFLFCKHYLELIPNLTMIGFDLDIINEHVMIRLLNCTYVTCELLNEFLNVGFKLTDVVVKKSLANGKLHVFTMLNETIQNERLNKLAHQTIYDIFGPFTSNLSLNIKWNSSATNRLIHTFQISESHIRSCILSNPGLFF
jgi:hypothetical protein